MIKIYELVTIDHEYLVLVLLALVALFTVTVNVLQIIMLPRRMEIDGLNGTLKKEFCGYARQTV